MVRSRVDFVFACEFAWCRLNQPRTSPGYQSTTRISVVNVTMLVPGGVQCRVLITRGVGRGHGNELFLPYGYTGSSAIWTGYVVTNRAFLRAMVPTENSVEHCAIDPDPEAPGPDLSLEQQRDCGGVDVRELSIACDYPTNEDDARAYLQRIPGLTDGGSGIEFASDDHGFNVGHLA